MRKIFTISNLISFLRMLLAAPMVYALAENSTLWIIVLIFAAYLSDILDGYLARKLNQVTEAGKIIDPIADKVFIISFVVTLLVQEKIPVYFAMIIIARDFLIIIGAAIASKKVKSVPPSDYVGKVSVLLIGLSLFFFGLKFYWLEVFSLSTVETIEITVVILAVSSALATLINYSWRAFRTLTVSDKTIVD